MLAIGLACLALWAVLRRPWKPPTKTPVWILEYRDRGRLMEYVLPHGDEPKAVIAYVKAGLNPTRITRSYASHEIL